MTSCSPTHCQCWTPIALFGSPRIPAWSTSVPSKPFWSHVVCCSPKPASSDFALSGPSRPYTTSYFASTTKMSAMVCNIAMVCCELLWFAMVCYELLWFAMVCYGLLWIAMDCYDCYKER
jgi:hypothetical protein